ncbi:MAG: insulinase family protein [Bacteroidaceae bacterium]|nr:insulinase family protein [Bacteroidaceae bacterium]
MAYNIHTLNNGLRIIHAPSVTNVAYCGIAVNAGTRDELDTESGMAHFVEHMSFKGTTKRRSWHIINRMEAVGGELNAYTGKEETVYYTAFMKEDFQRAAELLFDICQNSTFPQQEINKEVEVIIDEIESYNDTPSELIFDDFENIVFNGHQLGRNILGSSARLRQYTTADAKAFTNRLYNPQNMVMFVFGDIDFGRIVKTAERYSTARQAGALTPDLRKNTVLPEYKPQYAEVSHDTHQAHVMLGARTWGANDKRRTGLYILNNILGGPGMNSRLNISLRERHGLVYTVESNLTNYTDTGLFSIYFGCDQSDVDKCIRLARNELQKIIDNRLTNKQFAAIKKQLKGQIGIACDNFENCALSMAKGFLHYNSYKGTAELFRRIDETTPEQLQQIAAEAFSPNRLSTLIYK